MNHWTLPSSILEIRLTPKCKADPINCERTVLRLRLMYGPRSNRDTYKALCQHVLQNGSGRILYTKRLDCIIIKRTKNLFLCVIPLGIHSACRSPWWLHLSYEGSETLNEPKTILEHIYSRNKCKETYTTNCSKPVTALNVNNAHELDWDRSKKMFKR